MWRCMKCGEKFDESESSCWSCGTSKNGEPAPLPKETVKAAPPEISYERPKAGHKSIAIAAIVILLVAATFLVTGSLVYWMAVNHFETGKTGAAKPASKDVKKTGPAKEEEDYRYKRVTVYTPTGKTIHYEYNPKYFPDKSKK